MIDRVRAAFEQHFSAEPVLIASPGRINLIGEHTDYNDGFVLPAAIDRRIYMAIAANGQERRCRLYALDYDEAFEADLDAIEPLRSPDPLWPNYILGVAAELQGAGAQLRGFDCVFVGNIPIGGGMSSSAALENATALGLDRLFELAFSPKRLLGLSQLAEHHYAGVKCGIMDQFATMMGQEGQAIRLDCRSLDFDYVPLNLGDHLLLLCDSNVSHSLAASEYNTRRRECEEAVQLLKPAFPDIRALRDVSPAMLEAESSRLRDVLYRRAHHVVTENERVHQAVEALSAGDLMRLGGLMYQSHDSLQHDYEVSCPELDFLVDFTRDKPYVLGSRMMGGGFGGCTLNLIEADQVDSFVEALRRAYQEAMGREMKDYAVRTSQGTRVV